MLHRISLITATIGLTCRNICPLVFLRLRPETSFTHRGTRAAAIDREFTEISYIAEDNINRQVPHACMSIQHVTVTLAITLAHRHSTVKESEEWRRASVMGLSWNC